MIGGGRFIPNFLHSQNRKILNNKRFANNMTIETLIRQPRPWLQRRFAATAGQQKGGAIGGGTDKIVCNSSLKTQMIFFC